MRTVFERPRRTAEPRESNLVVRITVSEHDTIRAAAAAAEVSIATLVRSATLDWAVRVLRAEEDGA
jgi:predicted HicB family RNase H-like nuclease